MLGFPPVTLFLTLVFILLGGFASGLLTVWEPYLVLGMMLLLGLPHGATDHGLFVTLNGSTSRRNSRLFYLAYLGVIAAYGLLWYFVPVAAFALFMLLSFYHFGQSNWVDVDHNSKVYSRLHYLLWGAGVLLTPILLHGQEASAIVAGMTGVVFTAPDTNTVILLLAGGALLNALATGYLRLTGRIDNRRLARELIGYGLLMAVFLTNSLLLGFAVYFVLWHSLGSARDQIAFFRQRLAVDFRRRLFLEIGMTTVGALVFCLVVWFGLGADFALQPAVIGGVFIAISLLTLPHMILVEQLYTHWSPAAAAAVPPPIQEHSSIQPLPATKPQMGKGLTIIH